jgi:hypothetical protein
MTKVSHESNFGEYGEAEPNLTTPECDLAGACPGFRSFGNLRRAGFETRATERGLRSQPSLAHYAYHTIGSSYIEAYFGT